MTLQNVCRETFCSLKTFRNLFSLQIEALKHFNVSNLSPFVGFDYERSRDIFEFFDLFLVLFIILATEKYWQQKHFAENIEAIWASSFKIRAKIEIQEQFSVRLTSQTSLNFIRLLRVVFTPSVTSLLRGENDSKQSDEIQDIRRRVCLCRAV